MLQSFFFVFLKYIIVPWEDSFHYCLIQLAAPTWPKETISSALPCLRDYISGNHCPFPNSCLCDIPSESSSLLDCFASKSLSSVATNLAKLAYFLSLGELGVLSSVYYSVESSSSSKRQGVNETDGCVSLN